MISAIVLAAGQSVRMGRSKLVLPWGKTTVIGKVITTLLEGGINNIYVIGGGNLEEIKSALQGYQLKYIYNPDYENGEMITSVKTGLQAMDAKAEALFIVLGDQPHVDVAIIKMIIKQYSSHRNKIIVPSYKHQRGHPWLVERSQWNGILNIDPEMNLRDYLDQNQDQICYLNVDTPAILQDLDTPEDYLSTHP